MGQKVDINRTPYSAALTVTSLTTEIHLSRVSVDSRSHLQQGLRPQPGDEVIEQHLMLVHD